VAAFAARARFARDLFRLALDPSPALTLAVTTRKRLPITVACVYRAANAVRLQAVLAPAERAGADVRLWALDESVPALDDWTRGEGPGGRFHLLNRLLRDAGDGYVVILDDDVVVARGNIVRAVQLTHHLGLHLAQPGHTLRSKRSYPVTLARPFSAARRTNFVEIGPVVVAAPEIRAELLPFSEATPMGWAVDTEWSDLEAAGHPFGILDAVRVRHLGAVAGDYDEQSAEVERHALAAAAHARGLDAKTWRRTHATIRPWALLTGKREG